MRTSGVAIPATQVLGGTFPGLRLVPGSREGGPAGRPIRPAAPARTRAIAEITAFE